MKKVIFAALVILVPFLTSADVSAHFGMIIPSDSMVMQEDSRSVNLSLSFSHPFEMIGMELVKPERFGVVSGGETKDLKDSLRQSRVMGHTAWETDYKVKRPGVYQFYMEPAPYWEPAEDCYIVHYTRTVVTAFGDDEGWDAEIGLKTEIVPLAKPFGLYAGNLFQGIIKVDGKPVPFGEVEVEFYNREAEYVAPTDYMVCQTVKADANGVFTYAVPCSGWWGFAALNTAKEKMMLKGVEKDVEIGAVLWINFHDLKTKKKG